MTSEVDNERIQHIGALGEHLFAGLCLTSKFNKTRPDYDSFGWDFFVEIPISASPNVYADARQGAMTALVQVKATDDFDGAIKTINVKNHEYLSKYLMPTFVFIVDFAGEDQPRAAYLCHYNTVRIAATLKRLRVLEAKRERNFHKHHMVLRPTPDEAFDLNIPKRLQTMLSNIIGPDYGAYVRAKEENLRTLGFEDGRHTFSFNTDISIDAMTDAMLGLRSIDFSSGLFADLRFGIELGRNKVESGVITIEPSFTDSCILLVDPGKQGDRVKISAKVNTAAIPGLEAESFKFRAFGDIFSIVISKSDINVSFNLKDDTEYNINTIVKELKFLQSCFVEDTSIKLLKNNRVFCTARLPDCIEGSGDLRYLIYLAEGLERFLSSRIHESLFKISIRNIYDHRELISYMRLIDDYRGTEFTGEISSLTIGNLKKQPGIFYLPLVINTNQQCLVAFAHWKTAVDLEGHDLRARLTKGRVWDTVLTSKDGSNIDLQEIWKEFVEFCKVPSDHVVISRTLESTPEIEAAATDIDIPT